MNNVLKFPFILPVLCFCMFSCRQLSPGPDDNARITGTGGVILAGKYVPPASPDKLTFILLHGLGSGKGEWYSFVDKLTQQGYGYLLYDLRGHADSTKDKSGNTVDYKYFLQAGPGSEWEKMVPDLNCAVKYLVKKGINKNKIALMGASLGANVSLLYAVKNKTIPLVVLLSPGWSYAGLNIDTAIKEYGDRPLLIAASPGDKYAYDSSIAMVQYARMNKTKVEFLYGDGAKHGVQMFDGKFEPKLLSWINGNCR